MEYYKDDFLEFEEMMIKSGKIKQSKPDQPHASSTLLLSKFARYEKWCKMNETRLWKDWVKFESKKSNADKTSQAMKDKMQVNFFSVLLVVIFGTEA